MNLLLSSLIGSLAFQWIGFAFAAALQTEKFYDLFGSLNFVGLAIYTYLSADSPATKQQLGTALVCVWALRLGSYLFTRVLKHGKDSRFDKVKTKPAVFLVYWTVQAIWVWTTSLPLTILNSNVVKQPISAVDLAGFAVWIIGFATEVIADSQKSAFRANPKNQNKWIDEGLWHYSQYPNYFGEILLWWGFFIFATSSFGGAQHLAVVSPIFVTYLLTRVSGIPPIARANKKRWGENAEYQKYRASTSLLIPAPKSK